MKKDKKIVRTHNNLVTTEYNIFFDRIKKEILQTQLKAATAVTQELTLLYWRIGKELSEKIYDADWGAKIIEKLAHDLENAFPQISGFSLRNLKYMKKIAEAYSSQEMSTTAIALIPWGHNIMLLEKLSNHKQRLWYAQKTLDNNWSRTSLSLWIESDLYNREGKAISNFKTTLPQPQSDLAEQTLKDPYTFDFLIMSEKAREREIEQGLMSHMQKFLIQLGQGFAFVASQYHVKIGSKDFYLDMLFYHLILRCYIVVELKTDELHANNIGQMNLYLSAIDSQLKHANDKPTIGLLLCKSKDNYVAEYALRDIKKPIGISSYTAKLVESLPTEFKKQLPSIKDIETELGKVSKTKRRKRLLPGK